MKSLRSSIPALVFASACASLVACAGDSAPSDPIEATTTTGVGGGGEAGSGGGATVTTTGSGGSSVGSGGSGGSSNVDPTCPRVRISVTPGATLNVRPTPSTAMDPVGALPNNAVVDVLDEVVGEAIDGNDVWYEITLADLQGFIFSAYAACTTDEVPELQPPAGFWLPLECGKSAKISQGNFGSYSHQGKAKYAFDFSLGLGTPMTAMADGVVKFVYADTGPGDPCYNGGGPECFPYANLVSLLHGDGTRTIYKHLNKVNVAQGEFVPQGTVVGLSGSTGYSTGPHAHVMRTEDCPDPNCQSIPLSFEDVPGNGVPVEGQTVTSGNCP